MDSIFTKSPALGTLTMLNVYEFYEQPRLFSLENEVGSYFVAYWLEETELYEGWLIIPISRLRLNRFENREIDIRDLLLKQEQPNCFKLDVIYDTYVEKWTSLTKSDLEKYKLPREGLFISEVTPAGLRASNESQMIIATHEVRISKTVKDSNPRLDQVTKLFDNFSSLYKSFLDSINIKSGGIEPISARPGSFILSFSAEHMNDFNKVFGELVAKMHRREEIHSYMQSKEIDIRAFVALLNSILQESSNFEVKDNSTQETVVHIRKADAAFYLPQLTRVASQYITSYQVPQANDLNKIFLLVKLSWEGEEITPLNLKTEQRHVAYYKHAARLLGLFEANGTMTAVGQQVAEASDEKRLSILAKCFEASYCGWAWILWSQAENLMGVNPETAAEFLRENCPSLSENTATRRSSTLRKWCEEFQNNYPHW
ncbi:DUF6575 domain-containing protein [Enterobacter asburiae]|uniref:DUF6575 domain-containing protein n=1 Tax=Enterobacter asburiae TaxID=61645 RepID=UPI00132F7C85|nr:DUF6575 domain-containing protein [Enterobacter asburiae]